jgi:hypothetical protein
MRSESGARDLAAEKRLPYGLSVFDGLFYVGTHDQLAAVGCVSIAHPCTHNAMVERAGANAWQCADCGYVYGS